ncbi:hypothetical protein GGU10DRAFT_279862 [Lentinula aff. detonsa]|uniref:Uncharacterized protein n=1 Tax=Lentinula aff. detonsa TaxID=2804958 RepID=A0AA38KD27_9AGAR|nr:hypothetical protein GGU10DRAFT_279862 [Lentinula aff. detonsa]
MLELIRQCQAPWNAVAPLPIALKGLFNLDVDDNIWEDIGLNDDDDEGPPPWLSSERVRKGIKGILLRDRSDEELRRLRHEMRAMREWMREEWELLLRAIDGVKASGMFLHSTFVCQYSCLFFQVT